MMGCRRHKCKTPGHHKATEELQEHRNHRHNKQQWQQKKWVVIMVEMKKTYRIQKRQLTKTKKKAMVER